MVVALALHASGEGASAVVVVALLAELAELALEAGWAVAAEEKEGRLSNSSSSSSRMCHLSIQFAGLPAPPLIAVPSVTSSRKPLPRGM